VGLGFAIWRSRRRQGQDRRRERWLKPRAPALQPPDGPFRSLRPGRARRRLFQRSLGMGGPSGDSTAPCSVRSHRHLPLQRWRKCSRRAPRRVFVMPNVRHERRLDAGVACRKTSARWRSWNADDQKPACYGHMQLLRAAPPEAEIAAGGALCERGRAH